MTDQPARPADVLMVSHTHWDREWYRTFEAFRARLVDTVDRVLAQLDEDPGWSYLLDGQSIVVEDYLAVRPGQRERLEAAVSSGRMALGPWYVQPDSLLPSGESHVRNLLEGRLVANDHGGCSRVAYTPDSFGHPSQFPQLFAGFGLGPFVYWRGNGDEFDDLGGLYRWEAPDGSEVLAYVLSGGYSSAACLPNDPAAAADLLIEVLDHLASTPGAPAVLMNGVDHMYPDANTEAVSAILAERSGRVVRRGVLDDLIAQTVDVARPAFRGELLGGRLANLLPGVWSSRLPLKLANRRAEMALFGWAEPWAALGLLAGLDDETPSLRAARRALLANQAHDSIGGCSQDEVHRQMWGRYATATELADQTTSRVLDRLAGLGDARQVPWSTDFDIAVFNPSPVPRTDVVRVALDGFPLFRPNDTSFGVHPLALADGQVAGYVGDGRPARLLRSTDPARVRVVENWLALDLELVVTDVPAFGWRRVSLAASDAHDDEVDSGAAIVAGDLEVQAADDGTFTLRRGERRLEGLCGIEDVGDRGDTYDFDPVDAGPGVRLESVTIERRRHTSGIQTLAVTRVLAIPAHLASSRNERGTDTVDVTVRVEARVAPGIDRVDLRVELDDPARDHRLRLLFPTGTPTTAFRAATTLDVATRNTGTPPAHGWQHPPTPTFPHQGWVEVDGLSVLAPGLPEAEVTTDGTVAITLLRSVGFLTRLDLRSRPIPAGPTLETPEAQCLDGIVAEISLRLDADPATLLADEIGLRAVPAGDAALVAPETSLLRIEPREVVLSALKPADDGDGIVLRVLNPGDQAEEVVVTLGFPVAGAASVRLDETADGRPVRADGTHLAFTVEPHGTRSIRLPARP